jgi:hypothetical protein
MNDVFDAIEKLSAELSSRVGRLAETRGWGHKPFQWMVANGEKPILLVNTTLSLPSGFFASFTPRIEPSGNVWAIDVRRTDGVVRPGWAQGLLVMKMPQGWVLSAGAGALNDEQLSAMMDLISEP